MPVVDVLENLFNPSSSYSYNHLITFTMGNKLLSIPKKPYIKGQYWMITTIPLDDNYQPGSYHPVG